MTQFLPYDESATLDVLCDVATRIHELELGKGQKIYLL